MLLIFHRYQVCLTYSKVTPEPTEKIPEPAEFAETLTD